MKDLLCDEFQETVGELLIRHQSILDVITKYQESCARTNRAVVKAVTNCGCLKVEAEKHPLPPDASLEDLRKLRDSHLRGKICDQCREIVEDEIGRSLFYLAALCNILDINLYDCFIKEHKKLNTLSIFNMR
ncbi:MULTISPECIES: DUF1573 domain-containing protein [Carboxydocella]|uniref:DUF1573 domain-containing protein n=2 Tax=Carboxydocella TaxID=178898 RepID=A0A1T4S619_9FIRM|nr:MULTISPECIES: DUF1573 domain-containing protein [Carboxydocella]AVX21840.1 hypothetical protein CFE_2699 [Carboxydocella thermautotrophica]AVX32239.1 hypothetical protein CTH_2706 [Carboxydocella thermautotrophica]SKA23612.1 hypothetical protein SAMN02745885_02460 [Carboxydocella sporoproducens DSM 16521]GAW27505.1 hypothetical protein ULO1_00750 [Carboxydocella sp. ULO1]GAW32254.1 hypothetical protein JDF658_20190 [Carboxydocella sp. JDF658]